MFSMSCETLESLRSKATRASENVLEVGGLIGLERETSRIDLYFAPNETDEIGTFLVSTEMRRRLEEVIEKSGREFFGFFHSHPVGSATLSPSELSDNPGVEFFLIYDVCGSELKLWKRDKGSTSREVPLVVTQNEDSLDQVLKQIEDLTFVENLSREISDFGKSLNSLDLSDPATVEDLEVRELILRLNIEFLANFKDVNQSESALNIRRRFIEVSEMFFNLLPD